MDSCWSQMIELYEEAFPIEERRPTEEWKKMVVMNEFFSIFRIEFALQFVGFITIWNFSKFIYIEHFAVSDEFRNKGIGRDTLKLVIEKNVSPIVLEVEPPIDELTKRRIHFYSRLGLFLDTKPYWQPPYSPKMDGVSLLLMTSDPRFLSENKEDVVNCIHKNVYGFFKNEKNNDSLSYIKGCREYCEHL